MLLDKVIVVSIGLAPVANLYEDTFPSSAQLEIGCTTVRSGVAGNRLDPHSRVDLFIKIFAMYGSRDFTSKYFPVCTLHSTRILLFGKMWAAGYMAKAVFHSKPQRHIEGHCH